MVASCRSAGVVGVIPGIVGMLASLEVLKITLGMKEGVLS